MTRVYAIHTGSYSDQTWGPVFSTPERALAYIEKNPEGEQEVKTYILDDENDTGPAYPDWQFLFDREGNVLFSYANKATPYEPLLHSPPTCKLVPEVCRWWILDRIENRNLAHLLIQDIHAPDLEHAVKIAADIRRQFLALR